MPEWNDYQEEIATFFRGIGMDAETNCTLPGVRTSHDIDIVVRSEHFGFSLLWIVECKHWRKRVSKLHVLALREIVTDLGADRGILMAESGFQHGAFEAAQLTNVQLTSLTRLKESSSDAIGMAELRNLQERFDECAERYWSFDSEIRALSGVEESYYGGEYSGFCVLRATEFTLNAAFRGEFPIWFNEQEATTAMGMAGIRRPLKRRDRLSGESFLAHTPNELAAYLDSVLSKLEQQLDKANAMVNKRAKVSRL